MNREELFDKHVRGELSAAETAELKQLLAADSNAGRAFVEHAAETTLFVRVGSQVEASRAADKIVPLPPVGGRAPRALATHARRFSNRMKWGALAACLFAAAIAAALLIQRPNRNPAAEARLTGAGVQVTRGGELLDADETELQAGDIIATPTNEVAAIVYQGEATRIEIRPNSVVQFGDHKQGKRFELRRGAVQARVAPQPAAEPMLVTTPQAQATVLGTEFVLRADERTTKLIVSEGKVQLACRANAMNGGYSATSTSSGPSEAKPLCKCPKCRGTNETSNCLNLKKKNEN
jgi:hypothetical protein